MYGEQQKEGGHTVAEELLLAEPDLAYTAPCFLKLPSVSFAARCVWGHLALHEIVGRLNTRP